MVRAASTAFLIASAATAIPAAAQERAAEINVPAGRAQDTTRLLAQQGRVSIGIRDGGIARQRLNAVRGRYTPTQALERMLAGTGTVARRVAPASFVIERAPPPPRIATPTARPRPAPPPASEAPAEDIIITASKRDVPLADYAGGAQVIGGEALSLAEAARGTDLIESRAASVTSTHLGPGRNKLFIRGIADSSFVGPTQATVGQYWGNSRITYSAPDPSLRLYDVKSIEVLEGPQGTLYGAGSLGGVVRVVPNAPETRLRAGHVWGGVLATQHGQPGADGGAILNVPVVEDRLALRMLGFGGVEGGYIDDRARGKRDINRVKTIGGRATLRYTPGDDWTIDITGLGQRIVGDDSQYADRQTDGLSRASAIAQPYRNAYWLGDIVIRKQLGAVEWTSSIGYANQHVFEQFEGPQLADPLRPFDAPMFGAQPTAYTQDHRISLITAETRLARRGSNGTGWLVGASLLHNRARVARRMGGPWLGSALTGVRNEVDEATLYGEYAIAAGPGVTLTLGGRATHSALGGRSRDVAEALALRVDPGAGDRRSETRFLPSAALVWRPDARASLFVRYQEGFRPGGIAVRQDFIQRFEGDRVSTAEAGGRWSARAVDASLTVSHTVWRNIQADIIDGFGFPTTANIGNGAIWSVGAAARWRPLPGLELDAAIYLNDSRITDPAFTILPVSLGKIDQSRLPNVADHSGRIGFSYAGQIGDGERFDVSGYLRYIGQSTLGIGAILGRLQGDYLDTGLELRLGNDRRGLTLTATNLFDSRGNRFALGSPFLIRDQQHITPLRPRSIRLGFDVAF